MGRTHDFIKTYPDEALLEEIRRVAGLVGKPVLTSTDFAKHAGIGASTIARRFGGWRNALQHAGLGHMYSGGPEVAFKPFYQVIYTDEELLEEIYRVAKLVEKPVLSKSDFTRHSNVATDTVKRRFGNWRDVPINMSR
ncbi:MAG: homing endonuclease associated repeat-containing protein [Armatimonadota bacterium]